VLPCDSFTLLFLQFQDPRFESCNFQLREFFRVHSGSKFTADPGPLVKKTAENFSVNEAFGHGLSWDGAFRDRGTMPTSENAKF
jgi:hypothetical protein